MSYYINIQKAIDYIENNLEENIKLEEIAKVEGYSISHFYRVFGALVGYSVKDYVRKRRLSNAMYDLTTSKRSVTEIAFEYGYESHEAFTRTFKLAYGESPSSFRKVQSDPCLFERINLLSNNNKNGVEILKPKIICKDERLLLGIERKINQGENIKFGLLSKVENEFMKMTENIENRINTQLYYAAYDYIETERLFLKNISSNDREFIFSQFSDDVVNRYLFDAEPLTDIEGADEIIDFYIQPEPRLQHRWIMVRKSDGVKMGTCGFHCWDHKECKVEIGYDLKEEFWGNGYMQEAMKEVITFASRNMNIKEISACISIDNKRSIRLVKNLGFVLSGSRYEVFRNEKYLHNIYSLLLANLE